MGYIWFDMDGTLADLYAEKDWLKSIREGKTAPFYNARCMYDVKSLTDIVMKCKQAGYKVGIISWLPKDATKDYENDVQRAKIYWLISHNLIDLFDNIIITPYGTDKSEKCSLYGEGILVDDEQNNLRAWGNGGTIDATKNILNELATVLLAD